MRKNRGVTFKRRFLFGTIIAYHKKTWLEIPDCPTKIQRWLAYFCVKLHILGIFFVRQPSRYIDYAYDINAYEIFEW